LITLRTYDSLRDYVDASARGGVGLLVVQSVGGLGKSHGIKRALALTHRPHVIINGHATPASTYEQLYLHRNEPIFIDDVDALFRNPAMTSILKCLCDTDPLKRVQYNSKSPLVADLPREFTTRSTVIVALNRLPTSDANLRALLTRGVHAVFTPQPSEVLRELRTWAKDKDVLALIAKLVDAGANVNLRTYVVAEQLKGAKLPWREYLEEELRCDTEVVLCHELAASGKSYKQRCAAWVKATGKTARSYDRKLRELGLSDRKQAKSI
jgi:hypothetical protein